MLGFINDCVEKYVIHAHGVEKWHLVKEEAECGVKDDSFLKMENYHDDSTVVLVEAISSMTGLSMDAVLREVGAHFVHYIVKQGYENLLYCQGRTLKEWLARINGIHGHLNQSLPNKMNTPEFWCEENADGTLRLFYMSSRGSLLAPLAVGLVTEVAKLQFKLHITMTLESTQGEEGARFTSWIVATEDPADLPRLWTETASKNESADAAVSKCPMSGMVIDAQYTKDPSEGTFETASVTEVSVADSNSSKNARHAGIHKRSPFGGFRAVRRQSMDSGGSHHSRDSLGSDGADVVPGSFESGSLSSATTQKLFPYHVIIDQDFAIKQVGINLPKSLGTRESILRNYDVDDVFKFVEPKLAKWTRSWMRKLEDQEFSLQCILNSGPGNVIFKGTVVAINPGEAMLVICPEANNLEELKEMNLTMTDLPAHGAYRDAIFLREHLSMQFNNALKMEKLSKTLQTEKELLESLLPQHAAEGLRKGESVKPRVHHQVTMFFSDVVGFTDVCRHIDPCEVVEMLNRLYMIMDYLAAKFNLFKVETIGDAYVAACGLPDSDNNHAANVANFAVAVNYCCKRVLSPLDGSPIKLRIGINSGRCASGIVGVTNPRYCVFGDTVNTTARHEGTGEAGRIHCSMTTMIELLKQASDDFFHEPRGMIEMKGKGQIPTYWLTSTEDNRLTNKGMLKAIDAEIMDKYSDILKQDLKPRRKAAVKQRAPLSPCPETSAYVNASQETFEDDEASDDASTSDFNASSNSVLSVSSSLGVSGRSTYNPSANELMHMLGGFLDGANYDEFIIDESQRTMVDESQRTVDESQRTDRLSMGPGALTGAVDDALRILDD